MSESELIKGTLSKGESYSSMKSDYVFKPYNPFEQVEGEDIVLYGFSFEDAFNIFDLDSISALEKGALSVEVEVLKDLIRINWVK